MPRCTAFKPNGSPCERIVGASQRFCFAHDPTKEEARKRNAAKAGASKPNRELSEAKDVLRLIADMVLQGSLDSRRAAVAIQAWNAVIRGVEVEHRSMKLARAREELADILDMVESGAR